jgi:hypothetical protein
MSRLSFRTSGLSKEQRQRWRRENTSPALTAGSPLATKLLGSLALGAAVVYATSAMDPRNLDAHGNPQDSRILLDAFRGETIAVLNINLEGYGFSTPAGALERLGFRVELWENPPPAEELSRVLETASQFWILSSHEQRLGDAHLAVVSDFFADGGGLFILGDNEPFFQDANFVAEALLGARMEGDSPGNQIIRQQTETGGVGFLPHPIMRDINNLFEGVTISTIDDNPDLQPLVFGSAGNLVVAVYDRDGKRAILDGGFTRLFHGSEMAGTERYIQNAAAWLALN